MISGVGASLEVLGGFGVCADGVRLDLPIGAQRMLAYLAVTGPRQSRELLATRLWADVSEDRAHGSLRTALWHLRRQSPRIVAAGRCAVSLSDELVVDYHVMSDRAHRILEGRHDECEVADLSSADFCLAELEAELLPGWDEEWLLIERERHRQLRVHSLEELSRRLVLQGHVALAVDAAYAAIAIDPLCESPHRALARAFIAEGNWAQAIRQFDLYRELLRGEPGLVPSSDFATLVRLRPGHDQGTAGGRFIPRPRTAESAGSRSRPALSSAGARSPTDPAGQHRRDRE